MEAFIGVVCVLQVGWGGGRVGVVVGGGVGRPHWLFWCLFGLDSDSVHGSVEEEAGDDF